VAPRGQGKKSQGSPIPCTITKKRTSRCEIRRQKKRVREHGGEENKRIEKDGLRSISTAISGGPQVQGAFSKRLSLTNETGGSQKQKNQKNQGKGRRGLRNRGTCQLGKSRDLRPLREERAPRMWQSKIGGELSPARKRIRDQESSVGNPQPPHSSACTRRPSHTPPREWTKSSPRDMR